MTAVSGFMLYFLIGIRFQTAAVRACQAVRQGCKPSFALSLPKMHVSLTAKRHVSRRTLATPTCMLHMDYLWLAEHYAGQH